MWHEDAKNWRKSLLSMAKARTLPAKPFLVLGLLSVAAWMGSTGAWEHVQADADAWPPLQLVIVDLPAPKLIGSQDDWINTSGQPVEFLSGNVYVVHFWTYGCVNSKRNLPAYARWQNKYAGKPLIMIGVHTPETEEERLTENVLRALQEWQITYPVLLDTQRKNWRRWQQQWWPTVYLVDKRGHVRFYWKGELEWNNAGGTRIMERYIEMLLKETPPVPAEAATILPDTRLEGQRLPETREHRSPGDTNLP